MEPKAVESASGVLQNVQAHLVPFVLSEPLTKKPFHRHVFSFWTPFSSVVSFVWLTDPVVFGVAAYKPN